MMVVDDDADLREAMELLLARAGRNVVTASDGLEALARLTGAPNKPCLVLLDLMMPRMDGFEVLNRMSADPTLSVVPVVVLTGAGLLIERRASELHTEVLRKPLDRKTILATVDRFCGQLGPSSPQPAPG